MNRPLRLSRDAQFYDGDAFIVGRAAEFLSERLSGGGSVLAIATQAHLAAIERHMREIDPELSTFIEDGRCRFYSAERVLADITVEGGIDPDQFVDHVEGAIREAIAVCPQPAVYREIVSLLAIEERFFDAILLEELWLHSSEKLDFSSMCGCPISAVATEEASPFFDRIFENHTRILPTESFPRDGLCTDAQLRSIARLQQKATSLEGETKVRKQTVDSLQEESTSLLALQEIASALVEEKDLEKLVQMVTDAGRELSKAAFGAFFYNVENAAGEWYRLYTLSGAPAEAFSGFPMPRNTQLFRPTFEGTGLICLADVTQDANYGKTGPHFGMPAGHLPVKSYLASPVVSKSGVVLGALFFGHPEPNIFTPKAEKLITALSAQAAVAIDNARLHIALQRDLDALKELERGSRRLATIVESSEDAIISKTLDGIVTTWNAGAEAIFGYSAEEAIGQPITMLFPADRISEEAEIIRMIRNGEKIHHYESQRIRKDGSILDMSLTISPIYDENGSVVAVSKIGRDVSSRKRNEEALEQATIELERSRDELERRVEVRTASLKEAITQVEEFSYTVSHDLRAPLRAISLHCNVLMEDHKEMLDANPEALASIQRIADGCARMDRMSRDVLAYGRVGKNEIELAPVSLDDLVSNLITFYPALQPPNAEIRFENLGSVFAYEVSLGQAIANLLGNAVKFVEHGKTPEVKLWSETIEDQTRLWIEDNGIGIDPLYQHRLFGIFERIRPDLPYEGTGVGLAIVRKAVSRMGGSVGVESDGTNGSKFWIELRTYQG